MSRNLSLHAYCVVPAGLQPPADLLGIGGAAVRPLRVGPFDVWVSEGVGVAHDLASVRGHDAVLRAALRVRTPVPLRFSATPRSADELSTSLLAAESHLLGALERVDEHVEMGLRIPRLETQRRSAAPTGRGEPLAAGAGRAYLEQRRATLLADREERARAARALDTITDELADLGIRTAQLDRPDPGCAGAVAHLVHWRAVRTYRGRVQRAVERFSPLDLRVSGPWAPYSFV